jgi:hypothetical protein
MMFVVRGPIHPEDGSNRTVGCNFLSYARMRTAGTDWMASTSRSRSESSLIERAPQLSDTLVSDELSECFIVRDDNGQALSYVYFNDDAHRRAVNRRLTKDEARRIAIAKVPDLLAART